MRRRPNPWITIPSLLTGLLGGTLGWMVTSVTCGQEGRSCTVWAAFFAVISFVAVTIGVALLLVLVFRSLSEWRDRR